jgi:hypothetical protein
VAASLAVNNTQQPMHNIQQCLVVVGVCVCGGGCKEHGPTKSHAVKAVRQKRSCMEAIGPATPRPPPSSFVLCSDSPGLSRAVCGFSRFSTGSDERQQWRLVAERGQANGLHGLSNL